jgi:hypothetical protein
MLKSPFDLLLDGAGGLLAGLTLLAVLQTPEDDVLNH